MSPFGKVNWYHDRLSTFGLNESRTISKAITIAQKVSKIITSIVVMHGGSPARYLRISFSYDVHGIVGSVVLDRRHLLRIL